MRWSKKVDRGLAKDRQSPDPRIRDRAEKEWLMTTRDRAARRRRIVIAHRQSRRAQAGAGGNRHGQMVPEPASGQPGAAQDA